MAEPLIEKINEISDEYYELSQELAGISERKGTAMLDLLAEHKKRNIAETYWDATADGKREAYLKMYLRGLGAKRAALILTHKADMGSGW